MCTNYCFVRPSPVAFHSILGGRSLYKSVGQALPSNRHALFPPPIQAEQPVFHGVFIVRQIALWHTACLNRERSA